MCISRFDWLTSEGGYLRRGSIAINNNVIEGTMWLDMGRFHDQDFQSMPDNMKHDASLSVYNLSSHDLILNPDLDRVVEFFSR